MNLYCVCVCVLFSCVLIICFCVRVRSHIVDGRKASVPLLFFQLTLNTIQIVPGSIPSQRPRHTKDVIKMVPVVPLFSTEHSEGKILALSQELR